MKFVKRGRPSQQLNDKIATAKRMIRSLDESQRTKYDDLIINDEQSLDALIEELKAPKVEISSNQEPKQTNMAEVDFDDFSPLEAPVKERSYNKQQTVVDAEEIPEPIFDAPAAGSGQPQPSASQSSGGYTAPQPEPSYSSDAGYSEPVNELDDKSKRQAASQLADTLLDAYKMAHQFAGNFAKVDQSQILDKVTKGELDPSLTIPVDEEGNQMGAMEFFEAQNEQIDEAFQYDPEFGKRVKPAMVRVFEKRGIGLTDEQFLMVEFGKDIAVKAALLVGMKKQQKMMLNMFITMSQQKMSGMAAEGNVQSVRPDHITQDRPTPEPEPMRPITADEVEDVLVEEEVTKE